MIFGIAFVIVCLSWLSAACSWIEGSEECFDFYTKLPYWKRVKWDRLEVRRIIRHMFACVGLCFCAPLIKPTIGVFFLAYLMATYVSYYFSNMFK